MTVPRAPSYISMTNVFLFTLPNIIKSYTESPSSFRLFNQVYPLNFICFWYHKILWFIYMYNNLLSNLKFPFLPTALLSLTSSYLPWVVYCFSFVYFCWSSVSSYAYSFPLPPLVSLVYNILSQTSNFSSYRDFKQVCFFQEWYSDSLSLIKTLKSFNFKFY